ncbi:MAG: hypothetical protein NVSMB23_04250 [Myxococcales bacterium]
MPSLIAALGALLAAQLSGRAVSPRDAAAPPTALAEESQVRDLCNALNRRSASTDEPADAAAAAAAAKERDTLAEQASARTYRVEVPSKGFSLGRYRPGQGELELDGDFPLRAVENRLSLDLDGVDDVAFSATPAQVASWTREKKAGTLRLAVVFRPEGLCAGNAQARAWRLAGSPLSWQLIDAKGLAASSDDEGLPAALARSEDRPLGEVRPRAVRVEKVVLDGATEAGEARLEGAQPALDRCASAAHRAGSLVVSFGVQDGRVRDPQVIVDGARDEPTSQCIAAALSGAALSGAGAASGRGTATVAVQ